MRYQAIELEHTNDSGADCFWSLADIDAHLERVSMPDEIGALKRKARAMLKARDGAALDALLFPGAEDPADRDQRREHEEAVAAWRKAEEARLYQVACETQYGVYLGDKDTLVPNWRP